jgi:hypothetical protein
MTIKRYTVSYSWTYDMVVDVDHAVMTDEKLHEINNFWSNADWRLQRARGDVLKAVLRMLALTAFRMTITDLDPEGRLREGTEEGWPPLDGSHGITLVSLDYFELDDDEISIKEAA